MKKRMLLGFLALVAPLAAANTGTDITLVHFADGDQWTTAFTIVNLDTVQASYTLYFYDDNGAALNLPITVETGADPAFSGVVSSYNGVLGLYGSAVIQTTGAPVAGSPALRQGWARLNSLGQKLGAQAVYVEHTNIANYEAAVPPIPSSQFSDSFRIAFDNTNGFFTGVAIVNWDPNNAVTLTATFRDQLGSLITSGPLPSIAKYGHTAILLNQTFPTTAGRIGTVDFSCAPNYCQIFGLGLRFDPHGPFTSTLEFGL